VRDKGACFFFFQSLDSFAYFSQFRRIMVGQVASFLGNYAKMMSGPQEEGAKIARPKGLLTALSS
jgi:hypothetical protein